MFFGQSSYLAHGQESPELCLSHEQYSQALVTVQASSIGKPGSNRRLVFREKQPAANSKISAQINKIQNLNYPELGRNSGFFQFFFVRMLIFASRMGVDRLDCRA